MGIGTSTVSPASLVSTRNRRGNNLRFVSYNNIAVQTCTQVGFGGGEFYLTAREAKVFSSYVSPMFSLYFPYALLNCFAAQWGCFRQIYPSSRLRVIGVIRVIKIMRVIMSQALSRFLLQLWPLTPCSIFCVALACGAWWYDRQQNEGLYGLSTACHMRVQRRRYYKE